MKTVATLKCIFFISVLTVILYYSGLRCSDRQVSECGYYLIVLAANSDFLVILILYAVDWFVAFVLSKSASKSIHLTADFVLALNSIRRSEKDFFRLNVYQMFQIRCGIL